MPVKHGCAEDEDWISPEAFYMGDDDADDNEDEDEFDDAGVKLEK